MCLVAGGEKGVPSIKIKDRSRRLLDKEKEYLKDCNEK